MRIISNHRYCPIATSQSEWLLKLLLPNTPMGTGGTWRASVMESAREAEKIWAWGHWPTDINFKAAQLNTKLLVSSQSRWALWIILNPVAVLSCCLFVIFDPILDIANNTPESLTLVKNQANSFLFHYSSSTRITLLGSHSTEIS